jgi:uncharacterized protein YndB with AHSA1/START domain
MKTYSFRMVWQFAAPIEKVWETINHPEEWPRWWQNCKNVERLAEGDAAGVGAVRRFSMQTQLPYRLQFVITSTRSEAPRLLEGSVAGNLEGTLRWELSEDASITTVRYFWDVAPTKAWMAALSPLLKPVFVWNHRAMMKNGGQALSRLMGAALVHEEYR